MENVVETSIEPRKEWVTPELQMIDIEQFTATGVSTSADGAHTKS
jgi:hypothetical protein